MEPLALKDIHLPNAIGWWPPAFGWWLLALLAVLTMLIVYRVGKRLIRETALKRARKLLKDIRQQAGDQRQTLTALSAILRRAAMSSDGRGHVAGLQGEAWLTYLDRGFPDAPFSQGAGRCLADAHFRPVQSAEIDLEALFNLCERWLKQQGKKS